MNSEGKHKQTETTADVVDCVFEYARETLSMGLEFNDAIRDDRILRCWRYFLVVFKVFPRYYAIEAFSLLVQEKFLFSPRLASQLKWSWTINTNGRPRKNTPCDLHMEHLNRECKYALCGQGSNMEHLNRECKYALCGQGSNVTDESVQRIGRCIGQTVPKFDEENGVPTQLGYHKRRSPKADIDKIVKLPTETSNVFHEEHVWRDNWAKNRYNRYIENSMLSILACYGMHAIYGMHIICVVNAIYGMHANCGNYAIHVIYGM